jgi:hypothetical protein
MPLVKALEPKTSKLARGVPASPSGNLQYNYVCSPIEWFGGGSQARSDFRRLSSVGRCFRSNRRVASTRARPRSGNRADQISIGVISIVIEQSLCSSRICVPPLCKYASRLATFFPFQKGQDDVVLGPIPKVMHDNQRPGRGSKYGLQCTGHPKPPIDKDEVVIRSPRPRQLRIARPKMLAGIVRRSAPWPSRAYIRMAEDHSSISDSVLDKWLRFHFRQPSWVRFNGGYLAVSQRRHEDSATAAAILENAV